MNYLKGILYCLTLVISTQLRGQILSKEQCFNKDGIEISDCQKAIHKQVTYELKKDTIKVEEFSIPENKQLSEQYYVDDIPVGKWLRTSEDGEVIHYDFSTLIYEDLRKYHMKLNDVDVEAYLGSGPEESNRMLLQEISKHFSLPKKGESGRSIVLFTVLPSGKVKFKSILRSAGPWIDIEAKRCVELLPDFTPAVKNDKPVEAVYAVPIQIK